MITVCSMFKNSQVWHDIQIKQVDRYFRQMREQTIGSENLRFVLSEGGSIDDTESSIKGYMKDFNNMYIMKDSGNAVQASISSNDRFSKLACITESLFTFAKNLDSDYTLLIESDIIINNDLISGLVDDFAQNPNAGIIAPIVMLENHNIFYDISGFIHLDGKNFTHHEKLAAGTFLPVQSVGSCALIKSSLIKDGLNLAQQGWQSMNRQIIDRGLDCVLSTKRTVWHPGKYFVQNRWI